MSTEVVDMVARQRRRDDIARLDAAVAKATEGTVDVADAIAACWADEAWRDDDDYRHARASGQIPDPDDGWQNGAWIKWRYGFAPAYAKNMLQAGQVRGVLAPAATAAGELPRTEYQARLLCKALSPRYRQSAGEVEDDTARDEAIRRIWERALRDNDRDPARAAKAFAAFAKDDPFEPIARKYRNTGLTQGEKDDLKRRQLAGLRVRLRAMLRKGWHDDVRAIVEDVLG